MTLAALSLLFLSPETAEIFFSVFLSSQSCRLRNEEDAWPSPSSCSVLNPQAAGLVVWVLLRRRTRREDTLAVKIRPTFGGRGDHNFVFRLGSWLTWSSIFLSRWVQPLSYQRDCEPQVRGPLPRETYFPPGVFCSMFFVLARPRFLRSVHADQMIGG